MSDAVPSNSSWMRQEVLDEIFDETGVPDEHRRTMLTWVKRCRLDQPSIHEILPLVKRKIGAIDKEHDMSGGGTSYKYRGIDDILNAAHDALVEYGVTFVPWVEEPVWTNFEYEKAYQSGRTSIVRGVHYTQCVRYRIYGPRGDYIEARVPGEAMDYSDKSASKGMTASKKIILSDLFSIPYSATDPDSERIERNNPELDDQTRKRTIDAVKAFFAGHKELAPVFKTWRESQGIELGWNTLTAEGATAARAWIEGAKALLGETPPAPKVPTRKGSESAELTNEQKVALADEMADAVEGFDDADREIFMAWRQEAGIAELRPSMVSHELHHQWMQKVLEVQAGRDG